MYADQVGEASVERDSGVETLKDSDYFGEGALMGGIRRTTVTARTPFECRPWGPIFRSDYAALDLFRIPCFGTCY